MIAVKIYWNTDADGEPVPNDIDLEDGPISYYGPFEDITRAVSWMENDYPDGDMDVYDMVADEFDLPEGTPVNEPNSIFGDQPDEDVRDDVEDEPVKRT